MVGLSSPRSSSFSLSCSTKVENHRSQEREKVPIETLVSPPLSSGSSPTRKFLSSSSVFFPHFYSWLKVSAPRAPNSHEGTPNPTPLRPCCIRSSSSCSLVPSCPFPSSSLSFPPSISKMARTGGRKLLPSFPLVLNQFAFAREQEKAPVLFRPSVPWAHD